VNKKRETVCVYCGASNNVDQRYKDAATKLGTLLGQNEFNMVYGGGHHGLMGAAADAALENGSEVIGIIPSHLKDLEKVHKGKLAKLFVVETMHERKQLMVDYSDAFVILPGGLGTMDEFFEIFTWWQLGMHDKPIIICNVDGYWDLLITLIDKLIAEGFCPANNKDFLIILDSVDGIIEALENAPREKGDPKSKWI
jgi:hypothetical protein